MEKSNIRRRIKSLRLNLTKSEKETAAHEVFSQLEKCKYFLESEKILMYYSLPDELSTIAFLEKWSDKKTFYLPRVNGVQLDILPYDKQRLETGAFNIEEPVGEELVNPCEIELIIVPAVAFDRNGTRLGRGKGFYDRLLSATKAVKIGVAYDFQLFEELPSEPHDIPVDIVITQNEYLERLK